MSKLIQAKTPTPWFCNFTPFVVGIEEDAAFRQQLRDLFDRGFNELGRGIVVCDESHGKLFYNTLEAFLEGASGRWTQTTQKFIESCDPERQIVVMAMLDNGFENETYSCQSFLLNIPKEATA